VGGEPSDLKQTTVAVLYGGHSSERDVSIASGEAVMNALRTVGFTVTGIDTGEPGYLSALEELHPAVVFIALHGKGGEDGCVQGVCEELGLAYTGSGVLASALAMDKVRSKIVYEAQGLPTPPAVSLTDSTSWSEDDIIARVGTRSVVKPVKEGSSVGMSIVHQRDELQAAIERAFAVDDEVLVERFVSGTEVTVAVLGNDDLYALPVIEIVPTNEFYDFDAKYTPGGSQHICPAKLSPEIAERCQELAIAAHRALGCRGVSRTDFIIDGDGLPWLLETNTIPGMTTTSLIPDAARVQGMEFPELCTRLVEYARQA
jgi:D-alanine-D-alanine ligase